MLLNDEGLGLRFYNTIVNYFNKHLNKNYKLFLIDHKMLRF